ncbi:hypothetical protein P186_1729 [Pyrobaculum ferrireducens]|uniref:Uncharacterized protein n=1 Tax=Pyrobaculum ferrireducens TaxID=1104324 RepID=G7VGN9_9CREN|nr:hypothetical protein P186_1729 [Pyrobaculum ferrireducens]
MLTSATEKYGASEPGVEDAAALDRGWHLCWEYRISTANLTYTSRATINCINPLKRIARKRYIIGRLFAKLYNKYAVLFLPKFCIQCKLSIHARIRRFTRL